MLENILVSLSTGRSFADSIELEGSFPSFYVAVVRASERTSDLPAALERYLSYATQLDDVRQKLISAAVYPALLVMVGSCAFVFLLTYVVPRFAGIYEGMRGELPWTATLMMNWGKLVRGHGTDTLLLALMAIALMIGLISTPAIREYAARKLLGQPALGNQIRVFYLARLYRTLGMLLEGGIAITQALEMSIGMLPSSLRHAGETALRFIKEGQRASTAFREANLSTPISDQMLAVGERGGDLGIMMTRVAQFYEMDTTRKLERLMRVAEPLLMTLIGLGIGVIIVLMYLPIFELAGAIQ